MKRLTSVINYKILINMENLIFVFIKKRYVFNVIMKNKKNGKQDSVKIWGDRRNMKR